MRSIQMCKPHSLIIYRAAAVVGVAALLTAASAAPSLARHHHADMTNTATETTTSVTPNGTVETTVTTATAGPDYRILADPDLSYFDIKRAEAYGMTDDQIAQAAKLAHYGMVPMSQVLNQVEDGRTMADLAMEYGVSLSDVMDASDWRDRIDNYVVAYDNTGWGELRHGPIRENVASYSSTTGMVPMVGTSSTTSSTTSTTTVAPSMDSGATNSTTTTTTTSPSDMTPQSTTSTTTTDSNGNSTTTTTDSSGNSTTTTNH
jgi:hypothetical protein